MIEGIRAGKDEILERGSPTRRRGSSVTLVCVKGKSKRNITFNLPTALIRRLRLAAAKRNQSMNQFVCREIEAATSPPDVRAAHRKLMAVIRKNTRDYGIGDQISWKREDLYDRVR